MPRRWLAWLLLLTNIAAAADFQKIIPTVREKFAFVAGGSGAVISADGYVVTSAHVLGAGKTFSVALGDGQTFRAAVCGRDPRGDLALLKISGVNALPHFTLADSDALKIGQPILAIGNPLALGAADQRPAFSQGVVSAKHQFRQGYSDALLTDAAINPGNSGGPLVDQHGHLVGISGMTQTRVGLKNNTGVGYAVPANQLKLWLPFLKAAEGGEVLHGKITGLRLTEAAGAVKVLAVVPGSEAATAGFLPGDLIKTFMGRPVESKARFLGIEGLYPAASDMRATVSNQNRLRQLTFTLPALRAWRPTFTLRRPQIDDDYPIVQTVMENAASHRAGLRAGDEILAIDGRVARAAAAARVVRYLQERSLGDEITLQLRRGAEELTVRFVAAN